MFSKAKTKTALEMEWVHVSPVIAAQILDHTDSTSFPQRSISTSTVSSYSKEMTAKTWHKDTGDMLRLCNWKGGIAALDGRHRLSAIVKSGIGQDMWVAHNVPKRAFKYIDQGMPRSLSHVMSCANWPRPGILSAAALMLFKHYRGYCPTTNATSGISSGSLFDWTEKNHQDLPQMWNSYGELIVKAAKRMHCNAAGMFFMFYQFEQVDHDRAVLLMMWLSDSYSTDAPSKIYSVALEVLDANYESFMDLRAKQMKVSTDAQKYVQLQILRFAWLIDIGSVKSKATSKQGFNKVYAKWHQDHGDKQPWTFS